MGWRIGWAVLVVAGASACGGGCGCTAATIGATVRGEDAEDAGAGVEGPPGDVLGDPRGLGAAGDPGASDAGPAASDPATLPPDPPEPPLHVAVISDLNDSYGSTTYSRAVGDAVAKIIQLGPDLVLCTGDMVAGQQAGLDYGAMWDGFHEVVSEPLQDAGIPLAVTPGNHDASGYPAFEGEREVYADEWAARRPAVGTGDRRRPARFVPVGGSALPRCGCGAPGG